MPIDPGASYSMAPDPNKPVVRQGLDMLFSPLFGADWRTSMFQQGGQQPAQSSGARNVTNAILGQPWQPNRGMGNGMGASMGQMPAWQPAGRMGGGFGSASPALNLPDDNRTHGGMGGGSHL